MRYFLLLCICIFLIGCRTDFNVRAYTADGVFLEVRKTGATFLSRRGSLEIQHEWIDKDGILHLVRISEDTEEDADPQVKALQAVERLAKEAALSGITVP